MQKVVASEKKPIKLWLDDMEDSALEQAKNLANLPFTFKHVAIMPDSHLGYGMPIGGVLATKEVVVPNAVGVDIGCGMCAVQTNIKADDLSREKLTEIMKGIRGVVPVGRNWRKKPQSEMLMPEINIWDNMFLVCQDEYEKALYQLGTLGGGNHFIEIQKDQSGHVWIMIHSGSRNLGKKVADHYNYIARGINAMHYSSVPREWDLAFLPIETKEARDYLLEMKYCVQFALANRKLMMEKIKKVINFEINGLGKGVEFGESINVAHNYARMENHFGKNVMVHRKGATSAKEGELGIIPGSQGTKSYIVKGHGNTESFESCSHGAGRVMGRKDAQRRLDLELEKKALDELGVIHAIRSKKDLDEAPGAYKDISQVMNNQRDLVGIVQELTPMAVIKG